MEFKSDKLIYLQLVDFIIDNILTDVYEEETQIPSVAELSMAFKINHLTALKGVGILVDEGILYKKRGIGMFVATGAKDNIKKHRQKELAGRLVKELVDEARKLDVNVDELVEMIREEYKG